MNEREEGKKRGRGGVGGEEIRSFKSLSYELRMRRKLLLLTFRPPFPRSGFLVVLNVIYGRRRQSAPSPRLCQSMTHEQVIHHSKQLTA